MEFCIQPRLGALPSRARSIVVLGRDGRYCGLMPINANRANCNGARPDEGAKNDSVVTGSKYRCPSSSNVTEEQILPFTGWHYPYGEHAAEGRSLSGSSGISA